MRDTKWGRGEDTRSEQTACLNLIRVVIKRFAGESACRDPLSHPLAEQNTVVITGRQSADGRAPAVARGVADGDVVARRPG